MKNSILLTSLMLLGILIACNQSQNKKHHEHPIAEETGGYDSSLAKEYQADDYGMRPYVMAFLYAGPNREQDSVKAAALQRAHLDNISRMADQGVLALAGPFLDDSPLRGIYVFAVADTTEAASLTRSDPAIQSGHLRMELKPWYGSAGLMAVGEIHEKIAKINI